MASGSFSKSIGSYYTFRVSWASTPNTADNQSSVTFSMYLVGHDIGSGTATGIAARTGNAAIINGSSYTWSAAKVSRKGNFTLLLGSKTVTISHNSDGSKSFSASFTWDCKFTTDGAYRASATASGTVTLDSIPRGTKPTLSSASADMGSSITIDLSERASDSFTHTLSYKPETTSTWTTITTKTSNTSVSFTVPNFASAIPNKTGGNVEIRCTTYSGNTEVGTKTVSLTASVPNTSAYYPTASISDSEDYLSGFTAYIQNHSKIKVTITPVGAAGSTIASVASYFDGKTYNGNSWTSDTITGKGSLTIKTTVRDSRGRSTTVTKTITVQGYSPPSISAFSAERCNENQVSTPGGNRVHIRYLFSVSASEYGNTATMTLSYKLHSDTSYSELSESEQIPASETDVYPGTEMTSNSSFDIKITVEDAFDQTERVIPLRSEAVIFDVLADGTGFAFGKTAENSSFLDIAWRLLLQGNRQYARGSCLIREDIPDHGDLDDITDVGFYRVGGNQAASTISNSPTTSAFILDVYNATGSALSGAPPDGSGYAYYFQELTSIGVHKWIRLVTFARSTTPTFGAWVQEF